jgi:hypothetical protein
MTIGETDFEIIHCELPNDYIYDNNDIGVCSYQFGSGTQDGSAVFTIRCRKRIERDKIIIFSCLAEKGFLIKKQYLSIHLLRWLTELTMNTFETKFDKAKTKTLIQECHFPKHDLESLYSDLEQFLHKLLLV